jgi:cell division protein FtsN
LGAVRVGVLLGVPLQLAGQEPTLDAVEALVREGDTEDARSLIRAWWAAAGPDVQTDEVQRGLWLRDYPSRQTGGDAETWLAVHGSEGRASPTSVVRVEEAPSQPPAHRAEAPVRADEPETAVAAENRPPNSSANGPFTVQIGAYLSAARATRMAERVTEAGFTARIVHVPGSPLFRVRVGRFASSAAATPVADSVGTAGFATYITGNAASERPYR